MDKGNKSQSLIVKIICLLLSLGLWLYVSNVENPARTYELRKIPVELINIGAIKDSKFAIVKDQEFTVDLRLEGPSSEIIKAKREDFKVVADMSAYALKSGENTIPVQIQSYPENINIKNNGFLGIKVNLEDLIKKELKVTSKINISYKSNIYEKDKTISPATVTISGGKSSVEKVTQAVINGEEKDVDKDIQNTYDIKFLDSSGNEVKDIEADHDKGQLAITVINGKSVPINLKTTGVLQQGLYLDGTELSKNYINIVGSGEILENIKSIDTEPLDISSLQEDSELNVKLNIPQGITVKNGDEDIKAKIKISKEKNLVKNILCNVNYTNLNENLVLESSTEAVNVSLSGIQSELDKISSDKINVTMDLSSVTDEGTFEYTPKVTFTSGENITVSNVENVKVSIKKKV